MRSAVVDEAGQTVKSWPQLPLRTRLRRLFWRDRTIPFIFAIHMAFGAVTLGWDTYIRGDGRYLFPFIWPPFFAAAGVACIFHIRAKGRSRRWWKLSGLLLILVYTSRAAVIALSYINQGPVLSTPSTIFGVVTWLSLAGLVEALWNRVLVPARGPRNG